jgi:uncharacterized protein involved in outer membrane biogenesis
VVLALTVALIGPYFIDWTSYRGDFEREASRILGREVKVAGDASARLLPFPSVTFTDVQVAGPDGQPVLTAETFSMDAELAPFLSGEVLIFDMRLVRPKAVIRIGNDGVVDWAIRPDSPFDASHVRLEKLSIVEGQVRVEHAASGRTHQITEINSEISAATLAGPWRVGGSMRLDGALTDFNASTGKVDETGAMRLRLRAKPQRYPFSIETDGTAKLDAGSPKYTASFKIAAYDAVTPMRGADGATFDLDEGATAAKRPPDYRLNGQLLFDHRRLSATEFIFETGTLEDPYTAEGKADLDLGGEPRFSVTATGAQFSFDDRLGAETQGGMTLERRIAAMKAFVAALPKPSIPGSVEVNLPAVVAGDTTFRDVRLSAEPAQGGWDIADFAVSMPGRATLEANGFVATTDDDARFSGDMVLAVGQPSGFATWLSREVDDSIRRLPAAGFSATVNLASDRQELEGLELRLGDARFAGRLESLTPADANPALLLTLDGGALDIEGLAAFASLFVSDSGATRLAGRDLDLTVTAGPVSLGGLNAGKVDTALRLKDGQLDIDRLTVTDLAGANVSATGAISGFPARPVGSLDAAIVSDDIAPLLGVLGDRFPDNRVAVALANRFGGHPDLGRDTNINVVASASEADGKPRFVVSAGGATGGSDFTLAYSSSGAPFAPETVDIDFSAKNADGAALFALYGLPALPFGAAGEASTELTLNGAPTDGMQTRFRLGGETAAATFDGTIKAEPEGVTAQGEATLKGADIEPWLTTAGVTLPGMGLGLPADLSSSLTLSLGDLSIAGLKGRVAEVAVSGDLTATLLESRPHLAGTVETEWLPLDLAGELVLGEGAFDGDGVSWAQTPFPPRVTAPFTADISLKAASVGFGAEAIARNAAMQAKLSPEGLSVGGLSADYLGGRLAGLFEVKNNDGSGLMTGQATLSGIDFSALPGASAVSGKANLSANLNASGKSLGGMVASLSGTGTAALSDMSVTGLNPAALPRLIAEADRVGRDINDAAVDTFAPAIAADGVFDARSADVAFTVAGGILRAPPVTLAGAGATLTADVRADLSEWTIGVDGEIAYDPGNEALVGSQPALNFVAEGAPGDVAMLFDTQPMAQFLTQRALELEQARVEAMQALLLEKQRLRREVRYYAALQDERARAEEERLRAEEEARLQAEAEAQAAAEAAAIAAAEEEARLKAEEEAKAEAEAEAKAAADAEAKTAAQAEEQKAAAVKAEADAKLQAEENARLKAAQDAQAAAEAEAREKARQAAETRPPAPEPLDMAGRPRQDQNVPRPQAEIPAEPEAPPPKKGFSLDSLFRTLGGGN